MCKLSWQPSPISHSKAIFPPGLKPVPVPQFRFDTGVSSLFIPFTEKRRKDMIRIYHTGEKDKTNHDEQAINKTHFQHKEFGNRTA
jgi:hypothetical protein